MNFVSWFIRLFTAAKGIVSLIICLLACAVLLSMQPTEKRIFHEVVISTFLWPVQEILSRINRTVLVSRENEMLKRQNMALRVENDLLRQSFIQHPRISELSAFRDASGFSLRLGHISGQDPGRYGTAWVIDLGEEDSVFVNMPVLTSKGVVGKISKGFHSHSLVQLITDPNFRLSVMCHRSRFKGMLESWKVGELAGKFPVDADIIVGDTLVTSGMGGVFPKGLLVGIVTDESLGKADMSDIVKTVAVKPFQNPHLVEEVFVLQRQPSWIVGKLDADANVPFPDTATSTRAVPMGGVR